MAEETKTISEWRQQIWAVTDGVNIFCSNLTHDVAWGYVESASRMENNSLVVITSEAAAKIGQARKK